MGSITSGTPGVIGADFEADLAIFFQDIMPRDGSPAGGELLIYPRAAMAQPAPTRPQDQVAIGIDFNNLSAAKCQANGAPPRARSHHKIVFKLVLIAVINEVDAGIEAGVSDPFECWHPDAPAVRRSRPETRTAGSLPDSLRGHVCMCPHQAHGDLRPRIGYARA